MTMAKVWMCLILLTVVGLSHERGLYCYTCFKADDPEKCRSITECQYEKKIENCGGREYVDPFGQIKHDMGCVSISLCPNDNVWTGLGLGPVGRRRRQIAETAFRCCDTDLCNHDNFLTAQTTQGQTTMTSCDEQDAEHCTIWGEVLKIDICNNSEVANKLCRHYCGHCNNKVTTTYVDNICKDEDICAILMSKFNICQDEYIAVRKCPKSCQRCPDVINSSTNMFTVTVPSDRCHDDIICVSLVTKLGHSSLCNDKLLLHLCPQTCHVCDVTTAAIYSIMPLSPLTTSGERVTDISSNSSYRETTLSSNLTNTMNTGGINQTFYLVSRNVTTPTIFTTSGGVLPTHAPIKQCIDRDPNCPLLARSVIKICSLPNIAMDIGCDLTCGYCHSQYQQFCKDLDEPTNYCQYENKEVICHDEKTVLDNKCFATCGRCDLFCTVNAQLCHEKSTEPPPGDKACADIDNMGYCKQINKDDVLCYDANHINITGCFSTCHRCDLHPFTNVSLVTPTTTNLTLLSTQVQLPISTTPFGDKSCKDTASFCQTLHRYVLCVTEEYIKFYGCYSTCNRCDLSPNIETSTTDISTTTTLEKTTTEPTTTSFENEMTSEYATTNSQTTEVTTNEQTTEVTLSEQTTEKRTNEQTTGLTTEEQTTEVTTNEQTKGLTTEEQTTEMTSLEARTEITTQVLTTTTEGPYAACKGSLTNENDEFYFLYDNGPMADTSDFNIRISSSSVKWVVLYNPALGICLNLTINNTCQPIPIPTTFLVKRDVYETKGVYVITSSKTSVTAYYKDLFGYEAFSVLPKRSLSMKYVVASYPSSQGSPYIGIVATQPETEVSILVKTPPGEKVSFNSTEYTNGDIITLHLNKSGTAEISGITGNADLTGTMITSNNDVAVQSGSDCPKLPVGVGLCNYMIEMIPAVKDLGTSFVVPSLFENKNYLLRIIAPSTNTTITLTTDTSTVTKTLENSGDYVELSSSTPIKINADKPVLTVYYQSGNSPPVVPFMTIVPPTDRLKTSHEFCVPDDGLNHHVLVYTKKTDLAFVNLDNQLFLVGNKPRIIDAANINSTFILIDEEIKPGHHVISSLSGGKSGVIFYGDGGTAGDVSYGFPI